MYLHCLAGSTFAVGLVFAMCLRPADGLGWHVVASAAVDSVVHHVGCSVAETMHDSMIVVKTEANCCGWTVLFVLFLQH